MNILLLTRSPVHSTNSTGNTLLNFFDRAGFPETDRFFALSLRRGATEPGFADDTFALGDADVLRLALRRPLAPASDATEPPPAEAALYRRRESATARYLAYPVRDLLWTGGAWKPAVRDFVEKVKPDIILFPTSGQGYHHRVLAYIHSLTSAPIVLFHGDDHFTFGGSKSPLFLLHRMSERRRLRAAVRMCAAQFAASEPLCAVYGALGKPCTFLTKGKDFSAPPAPLPPPDGRPLTLVYTGNILLGRWRSLAYLGHRLDALTAAGHPARLDIYTSSPLTRRMEKTFAAAPSVTLKGAVPNAEIPAIQAAADLLVHVESPRPADRAVVRFSFSTKLTDYLHAARPIIAVGPLDVASTAYLAAHDLALLLPGVDPTADEATLLSALTPATRAAYATRAYEFGRAHHSREAVQRLLCETFTRIFRKTP